MRLDENRSKEIGRRIAEARLEQGGMTQVELADLLGVSERSMQGYELGEVVPFRSMPELSRILKKPVSWFLHGDTAETAATEQLITVLERIADDLHAMRQHLESSSGTIQTRFVSSCR